MVAFSARLVPEEDGRFSVIFRDLPEANAFGEDLEQALEAAMYGLGVALEFRIRYDEPWPAPSPVGEGEYLIELPVFDPRQARADAADARDRHQQGRAGAAARRQRGRGP